MPFPVENLIRDRSKPVAVTLKNTALDALHEMIRYDYSQLPVVDEQGKPVGLVTSDTILRGLSNFKVTIEHLHVRDVFCPARTFSPEDDLFELLPSLRDAYAVLIVDNNGMLTGIVTDYDTSEFFRRRAEDVMIVEDIERTLRDFVLAAFPNAQEDEENQNDPLLSEAIRKISSPAQDQTRFKQALVEYLKLEHSGYKLIPASVNVAYEKLAQTQQKVKGFNDITFSELEALLLSEDRWSTYGKVFTVGKEPTKRVLDNVRQIRNKLAHFKGEVTELERSQLRSCREWLQRHQNAVLAEFPRPSVSKVMGLRPASRLEASLPSRKEIDEILSEIYETQDDSEDRLAEAEYRENRSKFAKLAMSLQRFPVNVKEVELTFREIEDAIGHTLPEFARQHRSWWANTPNRNMQAEHWLDAGWRVSLINLNDERVKFSRIATRARAYIDFFSCLMEQLRVTPGFQVKEGSPTGDSWHVVKSVSGGKAEKCLLIAVFGLHRKFRVELYIDCGDRTKNKALFDALLLQRERIQLAFGNELSWERLDSKQASRIAYYVDGAITDSPEQLDMLLREASNWIIGFYNSLREPLSKIESSK